MFYAFDLDGTLFDTRDAVLSAYKAVGVEPPPDFFGKPWHLWLSDHVAHRAKNRMYPKMFHLVTPLPSLEIYRMIPTAHKTILTGASAESATALCNHFDVGTTGLETEMTLDDKVRYLATLDPGIYFDDDTHAIQEIRRRTEWTTHHVQSSSLPQEKARVSRK